MKSKIAILLLLAITLSSCGADRPSTGLSVEATPPISYPEAEMTFDYSDHTNPDEARYRTILGDPSGLANGKRVFATQPPASTWQRGQYGGFILDEIWGYDVRSYDISDLDLSVIDDYNDLSFNTDTVWPKRLPDGFNPKYLLKFNKNPGLGIRRLHKKGVTGAGIGIAIIDQALLLDHEQYRDNLMYYEQIHCINTESQMHGPAVASIAVGKTIGVAPGAKLYYIAETHGHFSNGGFDFDASITADSILRVLEINSYLPDEEKIRVISISKGYSDQVKGYEELTSAIKKADQENIFVITTSTDEYYDFTLFGMNRDYANDPDDFDSYLPAGWIEDEFYAHPDAYSDLILVPMGSRTYAGFTGQDDYELGHEGGLSWAVPWCAGFYALCCQVKPDITPQEFIDTVKSTGVTTDIVHDGQTYKFGTIVNPAEVIHELQQ